MEPKDTELTETRERLIEAAGEVFAEEGFNNATVREICQRAGANIAAVNYHFGGKEKLYEEVLRFVHTRSFQKADNESLKEGPAEERLRRFIHGFLSGILDHGKPAWQQKLVTREMGEPTPALGMLIEQHIRPRSLLLRGIIREIVGTTASEQQIWLCAFTIVSQLVFYHHCRPVIQTLYPELQVDLCSVDLLADHIWRVSLDALRGLSARCKGGRP